MDKITFLAAVFCSIVEAFPAFAQYNEDKQGEEPRYEYEYNCDASDLHDYKYFKIYEVNT